MNILLIHFQKHSYLYIFKNPRSFWVVFFFIMQMTSTRLKFKFHHLNNANLFMRLINNYTAKSRGISLYILSQRTSRLSWLKSGKYSATLSGIIVSLFKSLLKNHSFIAEKLEAIFILRFLSPTHEITYIGGYLLTTDDEYSVHHDHIWQV